MRFKLILRLSEILPLPPLLGRGVFNGGGASPHPHDLDTHIVLPAAVADLWNKQSEGKTHSKQSG